METVEKYECKQTDAEFTCARTQSNENETEFRQIVVQYRKQVEFYGKYRRKKIREILKE